MVPVPHVPGSITDDAPRPAALFGRARSGRESPEESRVQDALKRLAAWINEYLALVLLLAALYFFTSKSLYNIPFTLMALLGMYRLWRSHPVLLQRREVRLFCLLFLGLWLPMLLSLPDAYHFSRSAQNVLPYLRFIFAGVYLLHEVVRRRRLLQYLEAGFFIIMTFWSLDGLLQFLTGTDIFGHPYAAGRFITGPFYPETTIGHVLAGLSALYFESLRRRSDGRPWIWLLVVPLFVVVVEAGQRSVWFMLVLNTFGFAAYHVAMARQRRRIAVQVLAGAVIIAAVLAGMFATQKYVQKRVDKTMGLFSTNIEQIDAATSHRVDAWRVAWRMYSVHWINGIGPRGFRFAYQDYADKDFRFYQTSITHPHMVVLEIMAESGSLGLIGYAFFLFLVWRNLARHFRDRTAFACFLSVVTASFPINSHVAFYGAYWSSILWWMIIYTAMNITAEKRSNEYDTPAPPPAGKVAPA